LPSPKRDNSRRRNFIPFHLGNRSIKWKTKYHKRGAVNTIIKKDNGGQLKGEETTKLSAHVAKNIKRPFLFFPLPGFPLFSTKKSVMKIREAQRHKTTHEQVKKQNQLTRQPTVQPNKDIQPSVFPCHDVAAG
jgi:hypothetical protein